eukprot:scaffold41348_cov45-Phaeocystis_antarctica.AAC.1
MDCPRDSPRARLEASRASWRRRAARVPRLPPQRDPCTRLPPHTACGLALSSKESAWLGSAHPLPASSLGPLLRFDRCRVQLAGLVVFRDQEPHASVRSALHRC